MPRDVKDTRVIHLVRAHAEALGRVSKVFTKSEFKPDKVLRFIHDPIHALRAGDWNVERTKDRYYQCGSILTPKSAFAIESP